MSEQQPKKLRRLESKPKKREPIRVLYVEDAAVIRDTIARLLEIKGYQVGYAKNGKEGVVMARKWKPDVVLMDLRMPVMDGYDAIQQIKRNPETAHLPIFVISAWSSKTERVKAKSAGADNFFAKPPELDQLTEAINNAVRPANR